MRPLLFATLLLFCGNALAEDGQVASLLSFEATAVRPSTDDDTGSTTSILSTMMEFTTPSNFSLYGGFAFSLGDDPESAIGLGGRYYSVTPAFQVLPGSPVWTFIGAGIDFFDENVYYPEAGFRIATSNTSRLDVFVKLLNSDSNKYDQHVMVGAGLTF
ncbi:hypothetical protein [Marinomonas pollencensis]|uniref:Outer membrane protein beta-barrel domain-containing protein n=1 Tax=Marinomonas pollencensis TaxID=491954 RepID=A0A3E0DHI4_9GAMM|nr:hypothetical protein [Marinomonas pollencensis]REG81435.1 hypothetical protein DFP81_11422 [Marinomonas pollencensis]